MVVCPKCGSSHPNGTVYCPEDGETLQPGGEDPGMAATGLGLEVAATAYGPAAVRDTSKEATAPDDEASGSEPTRQSTDPDVLIGQTVGGVYKVLERLGVGGMGVVYTVEHVNLGKKFALKVLGQVVANHPDAVERFRQEAVSASSIEHDNIVDIITLDATGDGHLYIVMELLKGQSLADALSAGPMAPFRALQIIYQVCSALHAAHEAGIIHRDLKPENVFLVPKGDAEFVKVLDFGISKIHDAESARVRITKTGHVLGTPLYMSPEQAKGATRLDRRVDVYSAGVMLFEMLSGAPPFSGDNYFQLIWKHSNEAPPELGPEVPEPLRAVVARALAKEPEDRYPSMLVLEEALAEAVPSVPPPSFLLTYRPSTTGSRSVPATALELDAPATGKRGAALVVAGAVVLALALLGGLLALRPDDRGDVRASVVPATDASLGPTEAADRDAASPSTPEVGPVPAKVVLTVRSVPPGAEVFLGAERLGTTPVELERDPSAAAAELRIAKRGYVTVSQNVELDRDVTIEAPLKRVRALGEGDPSELPFKTKF